MRYLHLLLPLLCLTPGCPWDVRPRDEGVCAARPNCGQCTSEALCSWNLTDRACQGNSIPAEGDEVVTLLDECPNVSDPRAHRP